MAIFCIETWLINKTFRGSVGKNKKKKEQAAIRSTLPDTSVLVNHLAFVMNQHSDLDNTFILKK